MRQSVRFALWLLLVACAMTSVGRAAGLIDRNAAARFGMVRAWFTQVGSARATGTIANIEFDHGTLLVQTTRGLLTALDGETGRILWSTQAGHSDRLCTAPAANAQHVVVVNGSLLVVIQRATGGILWERQLGGAPGAGPGVSDTHAFVPMINGLVEGYDLSKGAKQTPWVYKSAGRVLVPPMAAAPLMINIAGQTPGLMIFLMFLLFTPPVLPEDTRSSRRVHGGGTVRCDPM